MIQLTEILANGETQPVLIEVNSFNYMVNSAKGYGSIVYYGTGSIEVTESTKTINQLTK